jgi:hypothetical protein
MPLFFIAVALFASCSSTGGGTSKSDYGEYIPIKGVPMNGSEYRADNIMIEKQNGLLLVSAGSIRISYDLARGTADIFKAGGEKPILAGVFAETDIQGRKIPSASLSRGRDAVYLEEIGDSFGPGVKVSVLNTGEKLNIWQNFYVYQTREYVLLEAVIESPDGVETNYLAPIAAGAQGGTAEVLSLGPAGDPRFLFVPFDNDGFIRYRSDRLIGASESCEVTAVFDNTTREGVVTGSVTHDVWKTGIRVKTGGRNGAVIDFRVFGGLASKVTRDSQPHGSLAGHHIFSPKIFLGFYADWRDGMEAFGRANGIVAPPLPWDGGPPFGWNSWSAVADKISYDIYVDASDFVKNNLQNHSFSENGVVYINFDSFWGDNLTDTQIRAAVKHVKANGQHPGAYGGFYSYWDRGNYARPVEGTSGRYTYGQIVLKDRHGRPLPPIDGAEPLDPTHPGTILRSKYQVEQWFDYGFEYVKLDFMGHGAVEGVHHNKDIKTGIQAYNYGMEKFLEFFGSALKDGKFFLSLSIAPVFPGQYAHARRISCDAFGGMDSSEYMLNSLTYGWWLHGPVYTFNDPDHISVYNSFNRRDPALYNEGLTRYIASVISGGLMLNSDDFRQSEARERARQILTNGALNTLAASGKSFRPVEGNTNDRAADAFVRHDRDEGVLYLAVFNFSIENPKIMNISLERLGLDPARPYRVMNLVSQNEEPAVTGSITVALDKAESRVLKFF